jgi:hypothetical protein
MRFIIHVAIIFVIATFIFAIVIASINCRPFAASWNINVQGHCTIDPTTAFRYYSIPNIVSGAMLVIFPLLVLRKVRVEAVIKTGFCFTLLLLAWYVSPYHFGEFVYLNVL